MGKGHAVILEPVWANGQEYAECWALLKDGVFRFMQMKLIGKLQQQCWVQCCFYPGLDAQGRVATVKVCCVDVTADVFRNLDASSQVEAIRKSQGVVTFALDGTVLDANDIFLKSMGYTLDEVKGSHHRLFVSEEYALSQEYAAFWPFGIDSELDSFMQQNLSAWGKEASVYGSRQHIIRFWTRTVES